MSLTRLFISPDYSSAPKDADNGGIRRVCEAEIKYLHEFEVEIVHRPEDADVIQNHGNLRTYRKDTPILNTSHGLYWSRQPWGEGFYQVNAELVQAMRIAQAHTVPSEWVGRAIRRGGFFYPEVVYHGVDANEFEPGENKGYVIWNKARADFVSDPQDMQKVAALLPSVQFQTTIGKQAENVKVFGTTSYAQMKKMVSSASVYLCTARETFGIGTLEAMAAGVPIAGWDWGGQSEIVQQGETGYLAHPGNYEELKWCIERCISERDRLSANAYADARERWTWRPRIQQYAQIVRRLHKDWHATDRPKVSVIVTTYYLDRYLSQCLDSVRRQTFPDWECIVVDDGGSDETGKLVKRYTQEDSRFQYVRPPHNLGLPGARNFGLTRSRGRYIRHLDADDWLADNALELEVAALDGDGDAHIVYGHLEVVNEDGSRVTDGKGNVLRSGWPPERYDWYGQMAHLNQLPSCAMMRREVLERTGGYRDRMKRNEDAEFWCRATSLGFRAVKFTQAVTYFHRQRADSKGETEWKTEGKEPDWTAWFPWRMGASDYNEAKKVFQKTGGEHPAPHLVPFGAQGKPPASLRSWYVHDHAYPVVSVIVTCGPGHERFLIDALDSIQAQTFPDWECVVVNDTGKQWDADIMGAPWAKVVNMDGNQGAAAARNAGLPHTRGRFIVWMDADDYWLPWFLERMVAYGEQNDGVIYSDFIRDAGEKLDIYRYDEFDPAHVIKTFAYTGSSVLIPRHIVEKVLEDQGGWDTQIPGMEDWDYQIAMHHAGFCAYHIPEALFVYRLYSSSKREKDYAIKEQVAAYVDEKWRMYRKEGRPMGCGCNKKKTVTSKPGSTLSASGNFETQTLSDEMATPQMVDIEYNGPMEQNFSITSKVDRNLKYRFGNNPINKRKTVFMQDAQVLTALRDMNDRPLYRIVAGDRAETRDPSTVLGRPIA